MAKGRQHELGTPAPKLSRSQWLWLVLGLALIVVIAYGQTLGMYFWQDDAALMFKLQHPLQNAGSFGAGYFGSGPYKYLATPFIPLYRFFTLHPLPYFAVGLLIYFVLTLVVFWFLRILTQANRIATSGAALFAGGYFAQLAVFRLINSYQTNLGVILALVTFGVLLIYHQTRRIEWYLSAVLLFGATLELVLVRSHGLILPIIALELLYFPRGHSEWSEKSRPRLTARFFDSLHSLRMTLKRLTRSWLAQLTWSILRLIPFIVIYRTDYLGAGNRSSGGALTALVKTYLVDHHWEYLYGLAASFGNILLPDRVIAWLQTQLHQPGFGLPSLSHGVAFLLFLGLVWLTVRQLKLSPTFGWVATIVGFGWLWLNVRGIHASYPWYTDPALTLAGTVGGFGLSYCILLGAWLWKQERILAVALLFAVVWSVANYVGYFVLYPTSIMTSVSRYVMHSFVATVAIWAILIELLVTRSVRNIDVPWLPTAVATALLALVPLSLTVTDQEQWLAQTSRPTRAFYNQMLAFYPHLEPHALIWYDTLHDATVGHQFGNFFSVGSMPEETALAIYYHIDRYDLKLSASGNNFLSDALKLGTPNNALYTFFYDGKDLQNTTDHSRAALGGKLSAVDLTSDGLTARPASEVGSSTPLELKFDLAAGVKSASDLQAAGSWSGSVADLPNYFQYLDAKETLRRSLVVKASSEWSGAEQEFLIDGNYQKGWMAHRTLWPTEHHVDVTVTLPSARSLSRVVWTNGDRTRTPTSYTIEVSSDGSSWMTMKTVTNGPSRQAAETVIDDFNAVSARVVRMTITATSTDEAPGLIEFEVVPSEFGHLDPTLARVLADTPLLGAQDEASRAALASYLGHHATVNVTYQTDGMTGEETLPATLALTGPNGHYSVILPASGTKLDHIHIVAPNYLGQTELTKVQINFPTLKQLSERGFIERRSTN